MDNHRRAVLILIIIVILGFSCSQKDEARITRAYYFWRSGENISDSERIFLKKHQVNKLYVRLMDIDWSPVSGAMPVSEGRPDLVFQQTNVMDTMKIAITPVIFITNKTFEKISTEHISLLAKRIVRRCFPAYDSTDKDYEARNYYIFAQHLNPSEIQFDCDWTAGTRDKYFYFLRTVQSLLPSDSIMLSATIRLHQYKYPEKTGIPPVNRGMLMVYNITDLRQYTPVNSIYDHKKASAYFTSSKKYELPLDIVLPAYSWCIIFRNKEFYQIENNLSENELKKLAFLEKTKTGFYRVKEDTVFNDLFLRPGDEIKPEGIDPALLKDAAELARKAVNADRFTVSLFELSQNEINNYSHETIEDIYHSYR